MKNLEFLEQEKSASSEVRPVFSTLLGGYKSKHEVMDQLVS